MAGLATRCTACGTVFRVVPDQLRVAGGLVRCGRCSQVFNAAEALIELPPPAEPPAPAAPLAPAPAPEFAPEPPSELPPEPASAAAAPAAFDPPEPVNQPAGFEEPPAEAPAEPPASAAQPEPQHLDLAPPEPQQPEAQPEPGTVFDLHLLPEPQPAMQPEPQPEPQPEAAPPDPAANEPPPFELDLPPAPPPPPPAEIVLDLPPAPAPLRAEPLLSIDTPLDASIAVPAEPRVEADDAPSFVRSAQRAERWQSPRMRGTLSTLAVLGVLGLALQAVFTFRDQVVARYPGTRDLIEPMCTQVLGCRIEPPRSIESLAVESSGLVRVEKSSVYKLQVALRNRSTSAVAVPALELTLSDSLGKPIARRVLRATELGVNQTTVAAGRELALQATLQSATEPVAGYTIELFYP